VVKSYNSLKFYYVHLMYLVFFPPHVKMHLKGKYPLKNSVEIKTMIDQRTNGTISLEESSDIVGYMYNKDDSSHIMQ